MTYTIPSSGLLGSRLLPAAIPIPIAAKNIANAQPRKEETVMHHHGRGAFPSAMVRNLLLVT